VDERLDGLRRRLGVETIYQSEAPSRVPRVLRKGGIAQVGLHDLAADSHAVHDAPHAAAHRVRCALRQRGDGAFQRAREGVLHPV
jgi:hypothetical protein